MKVEGSCQLERFSPRYRDRKQWPSSTMCLVAQCLLPQTSLTLALVIQVSH